MTYQDKQHSSHNTNSESSSFTESKNSKYKDLNLSLFEDLVIFSNSAHEAYEEAISYKSYAESEQYKSLNIDEVSGGYVFETLVEKFCSLMEKVSRCRDIQRKNIEIPDELVSEMQVCYNDIILLKNYILEIYENAVINEKEQQQNLDSNNLINNFEENPNSKDIIERADEIIDRISSKKETPHYILHKATDLYEEIKDAELNLPQDQRKLLEAYKKLEDFDKEITENVSPSYEIEATPLSESSLMQDDYETSARPILLRKKMEIISDNEEGNILITVAKKAEDNINSEYFLQNQDNLVTNNINDSEKLALSDIEATDPINRVFSTIPVEKESARQQLQTESLVTEFITDESYLDLIRQNYSSVESFEKLLVNTIKKIDSSTEDVFERWLGEQHQSPFLYLKNKRISEVEKIANGPNTRKLINAKNIKYETFLTWIDLMYEMLNLIDDLGDVKFGELFVLWMIESGLRK